MDLITQQAERDFETARFRAFLGDVAAMIARRPNELVSFDAVRRSLPIYGSSYRGVQEVPLEKIVGSATNRYNDFDRAFLPAQVRTKTRWKRIDEARLRDIALPPIQLYQVGEVYFVRDGHHRVSVARQLGQKFIDAEVIEMRTRAPLAAFVEELNGEQLEAMGEYASFLEKTRLDELRPGVEIRFSRPGGYARLLEHIIVHQYFMGRDQKRDIGWDEAVTDWYDYVYHPIIAIIRERNILRDFPNRTEADLYLWITDHHWYLQQEQRGLSLEAAAEDIQQNYSPRLNRRLSRALKTLIEQWRRSWRSEGLDGVQAPHSAEEAWMLARVGVGSTGGEDEP
jgi:hypothetical protein